MATPEETFRASLADFARLNKDLAQWLQVLGAEMRQLSDARSARNSVVASGVSKSAQAVGDGLQTIMNDFDNYINNEITSVAGGTIRCGIETGFVFTGAAAPETVSKTLTGLTWVTANTKAICFPPYPATSAVEYVVASASNYVAGTGFDISASCGSVTTQTYDVVWIAFPDGYTD